jgi:HK97 family phage prohead protease
MPYSENSQLPEAVRNSLSEADQTKWRDIFNSAYEGECNGDDACSAKLAWSQLKKNARYFAGWASVELVDRQGDMVEIGAFQKALDFFMASGASMMDQHSNRRVGSWINYELRNKMCSDGVERPGVYLEGIVFKGQRIYDNVWEKVCRKEYADLSIGADPLDQSKACSAKTCWNAVKNMDLFEVSPVEVGANQEASIEEVNVLAKNHVHIGDTMAEEPKPNPTQKAADTDGAPAVESTVAKSDEILTLLKGLDGRLSEVEKKLEKEDKTPEEEEKKEDPEEEEEQKEKSAEPAPDIGSIVENAVDKALAKRMKGKEPDTPRPDLKKNELKKSQAQIMLEDSSKTAGMGYKQISAIIDTQEERPW